MFGKGAKTSPCSHLVNIFFILFERRQVVAKPELVPVLSPSVWILVGRLHKYGRRVERAEPSDNRQALSINADTSSPEPKGCRAGRIMSRGVFPRISHWLGEARPFIMRVRPYGRPLCWLIHISRRPV